MWSEWWCTWSLVLFTYSSRVRVLHVVTRATCRVSMWWRINMPDTNVSEVKQAHTPGPWRQMPKWDGAGGLVILGTDDIGVGAAWSDDRPECEANARLIAAAPELL